MDWLHPTYVWTLLLGPVALGIYGWAVRRRRAAREQFGHPGAVRRLATTRRPRRRMWEAGLVVGALLLGAVALMGPRWGTEVRTVERRGLDLVVALDVSASMRAQDVPPSRLRRAKNEIRTLVDDLSGDRVGLVLFAGSGFVQSPLTTDYGAFRLFLDAAAPDQVSTPGTDVSAAVDAGLRAFGAPRPTDDTTASPEEPRPRALLIVSDGENHAGDLDAARQRAEEAGVTLLTAGVGTEDGARIPVYENGRRVDYKRNRQGEVVRSRLREAPLTRLARSGAYFRVGAAASALSDVPAALRQIGATTYDAERFADYEEMYQWPLAAALLLLLAASVLPTGRRDASGVQFEEWLSGVWKRE
ncbi:VWA domain-containing protein [Salinibacter ruber]|uniref:VWA domain-containing protein n=1 Tax=Salinibacter ruber TaxID=146919 RepID=UPI002167ED1B|nr:VWA domain-containing protein [Salinibacter ruber]MCS3758039.1 Ca-activated chloride channel family protein [Salinibacter ruber]MCS3954693.1 Ca-activated chloride channel family protein [Salinibacter ruber]